MKLNAYTRLDFIALVIGNIFGLAGCIIGIKIGYAWGGCWGAALGYCIGGLNGILIFTALMLACILTFAFFKRMRK